MTNTIYFTEEQLERFLNNQNPKRRVLFEDMHKNDDKTHIDLIKTVQSGLFDCPDDIIDICVDYEIKMQEIEDKKNGIRRLCIGDINLTDEEIADIKRINSMSDKETEEYIKDLNFVEEGYEVITRRKGMF